MATTRETISSYYQNILGREADGAGIDYWAAQVDGGSQTMAEVVANLTASQEASDTVAPIIALYLTAFGRTPDAAGLQYWVAAERGGMSLDTIADSFVRSAEFSSTNGASDADFIATLYQNALGRSADAAGTDYWTAQLASGMTRTEVLSSITASQEGLTTSTAKAQLVLAYQGVLGRTPTTAELNAALQNQGQQSLDELVKSVAGNLIDNGDPATPTNPTNPTNPSEPGTPVETNFTYTPNDGTQAGSSDASGVISWGKYIIVGDDESNVLRVYDSEGGAALFEFDYGAQLGITEEMDFEAMTFVGNLGASGTLYLTGSHSNSKKGNDDENREHIVSLKLTTGADGLPVFDTTEAGNYTGLVDALVAWDAANGSGKGVNYFDFKTSSDAGISPENTNGFSIEGMTTSKDDAELWLGFRAPQTDTVTRDEALLIKVTNYQDVLATNASPEFEAVELNLGGRGIRSIEKALDGSGYLIIAGPSGTASDEVTHDFRLYTWTGETSDQPIELNNDLDSLLKATGGSFESIASPASIKAGTQVLLLQDNGDTVWDGQTEVSKDLDPANQQFKGNLVTLGSAVNDTTAPKLVSSSPVDEATDVSATSTITLTFDEGVALVENAVIRLEDASGVVEEFKLGDSSVKVDYNKIILTPAQALAEGSEYKVVIPSNTVTDHSGNALASKEVDFTTGVKPHYDLLITEVNSNANGGDFFEIYNYGDTAIDLSGWAMTDSEGTFASAVGLSEGFTLGAGKTLVIADMPASDLAAFKTAWGLTDSTDVISVEGPGLGKGDAVVLFDGQGNVATALNYNGTSITASDGTLIEAAPAASGTAFATGQHAGAAYGVNAKSSVVWDGVSTLDPKYVGAVAGDNGAAAQAVDANAVGSPGVVLVGQVPLVEAA